MLTTSSGTDRGYAGFLRRAAAWILDWLVFWFAVWTPLLLLSLPLHVHELSDDVTGLTRWLGLGDWLDWTLYFIALFSYWILLESSPWQATVGKRAVSVVVTDLRGERLSILRAFVRSMGKGISATTFIGYLLPLLTKRHQTLHDMIAGSLVLKAGKKKSEGIPSSID